MRARSRTRRTRILARTVGGERACNLISIRTWDRIVDLALGRNDISQSYGTEVDIEGQVAENAGDGEQQRGKGGGIGAPLARVSNAEVS